MTLTSRLSLFFTVLLALVLVGFSLGLYGLASAALHREFNDRLNAALNTLVAAAELHSKGVEWEPQQRQVALRINPRDEPIAWLVSGEIGQQIDSSTLPAEFAGQATAMTQKRTSLLRVRLGGDTWRLLQRRIPESSDSGQSNAQSVKSMPTAITGFHQFLTITVGQSLEPVEATLRTLAGTLVALTLVVGLASALASRWVCRRALAPVSLMADHTRAMKASNLDDRLPQVHSRDELEDLSQAFNGLLDRLQESFERQRQFTGDASHQLRTPLTAMLGQIEVALRKERSAEDYRQVLTTLQRQGQHLRHIVEALLFLARADSEGRLSPLEPLDLSQWLSEHLQSWSEHDRWEDVNLVQSSGQPIWVACQPALLGELVNNLLDNALKYSPAGSPVTVTLESDDKTVRIAIEDRGIGIAPGDKSNLFQPFFRTNQVRRRGIAGLGLGLAVASRLARAFGGTITVESQPDSGSRFTVHLPLAQPSISDLVEEDSAVSSVVG
jgi:heavy metal sensor kinase